MVRIEPALILPSAGGGYDEIIESMGLRFPLVCVTKFSCLHSALVGMTSCVSRGTGKHQTACADGLYPAGGVLDGALDLQGHSGRVSERLYDATHLSNVYHGNLLCGQLVWDLEEGRGHNAAIVSAEAQRRRPRSLCKI